MWLCAYFFEGAVCFGDGWPFSIVIKCCMVVQRKMAIVFCLREHECTLFGAIEK